MNSLIEFGVTVRSLTTKTPCFVGAVVAGTSVAVGGAGDGVGDGIGDGIGVGVVGSCAGGGVGVGGDTGAGEMADIGIQAPGVINAPISRMPITTLVALNMIIPIAFILYCPILSSCLSNFVSITGTWKNRP